MSFRVNAIIAAAMTGAVFPTFPALADLGHSHAGKPGKAERVAQTITVTANESDGGMSFEPREIRISKGETVRIVLQNEGAVEHELFLGTNEEVKEHAEQMLKFPEMEHDEPNVVRADPGFGGEILWQFTRAGRFEFACLLPGHMQMGMVGHITVTEPVKFGMSAAPKHPDTSN